MHTTTLTKRKARQQCCRHALYSIKDSYTLIPRTRTECTIEIVQYSNVPLDSHGWSLAAQRRAVHASKGVSYHEVFNSRAKSQEAQSVP